jgi:cytochrome c553
MRRMLKVIVVLGLGMFLGACAAQANPTPTAVPTPTLPAAVFTPQSSVDYCVSCHTDKDTLVQTAKPEEKAPSESEGVG